MRNFRVVFDLAQKQLRTVFGMQLVEQPTKDRSLLSLEQKRKGTSPDPLYRTTYTVPRV